MTSQNISLAKVRKWNPPLKTWLINTLLFLLGLSVAALGLALTITVIFALVGIPLLGGGILLIGWLMDPDSVEDEKRHWTGIPETERKE